MAREGDHVIAASVRRCLTLRHTIMAPPAFLTELASPTQYKGFAKANNHAQKER